MRQHLGDRRVAFRWNPRQETYTAILSVVALFAVYRASNFLSLGNPVASEWTFALLGGLVVATLLPALAMRRRRDAASALGLTRDRVVVSLAISAVFAAGSLPAYFAAVPPGTLATPHLLASLMNLWEPLFVYGWLQLRLEDAFGYVAAPPLAALCFAAYHTGSVPIETLGGLLVWGAIVGALFALTRNLLVVFPLAWGVASAIGTAAQAGDGWWGIVPAGLLLIGQLILLWVLLVSRESPNPGVEQKARPSGVDSA